MKNCLPVSTPIIQRLSRLNSGEKNSADDQALYRNMAGSLLYLDCCTRHDISFAVSERSWFVSVSDPDQNNMQMVNHLFRHLKVTGKLGLRYSNPKNSGLMSCSNVLWGFVDSESQIGLGSR
jgi:hypothetical protein